MDPVSLLIIALVIAVAAALLPLDPQFKRIAYIIVVVLFLLWILSYFGILPHHR